jgi:hypothetical protein
MDRVEIVAPEAIVAVVFDSETRLRRLVRFRFHELGESF